MEPLRPISKAAFEKLPTEDKYALYCNALNVTNLFKEMRTDIDDLKRKVEEQPHVRSDREPNIPRNNLPKKLPHSIDNFSCIALSDSMWKNVAAKDISPNAAVLSWPGAKAQCIEKNLDILNIEGKSFQTAILNVGVNDIGEALRNGDFNADLVANSIVKCANHIKTTLDAKEVFICRISPTAGRYQHYNKPISEVNAKLEASPVKMLDLELYDSLLFDGLHPRFPQGVHQMVNKVRTTLRRSGVAVAQNFELSRPRFLQTYSRTLQSSQSHHQAPRPSHPPFHSHDNFRINSGLSYSNNYAPR